MEIADHNSHSSVHPFTGTKRKGTIQGRGANGPNKSAREGTVDHSATFHHEDRKGRSSDSVPAVVSKTYRRDFRAQSTILRTSADEGIRITSVVSGTDGNGGYAEDIIEMMSSGDPPSD